MANLTLSDDIDAFLSAADKAAARTALGVTAFDPVSPGAIGGSTPAAGTFTTLSASTSATVTGAHLSGVFLEEQATNSGFVPTANQELVLKLAGPTSNVLALRNTDATGYSALTARDNLGNERFAIGYGNPSSGAPFQSASYIQTWNGTGAPPSFVITADGDYGNTGSGYRTYPRFSIDWDATFNLAKFNFWHHIPITSTQRVAFQIVTDGNVQNFAKLVQTASDCGIQFWKDATPSKAVSIGISHPGNAPGNDIVCSVYTGSAWVEKMRIKNGASGTAGFNLSGLPTSSAGLTTGDVWSNSGVLTVV